MKPPISQLDLDAYPSLEAGSPMSWEPSQTPANQESVSLHSPVKPGLWGQRSVGRRVQKGQSASSPDQPYAAEPQRIILLENASPVTTGRRVAGRSRS